MKILFLHSGDRVPSARFRILPYVSLLRGHGHKVKAKASFPQKYDYWPWLGFRLSQWLKRRARYWHLLLARMARFDVIVLERELFDDSTWDMEARFRKLAPVMILDVDDAIFLRNPEKFEHLASMCDHVFAGNALLAEVSSRYCDHVTVLPTVVNPSEYVPVSKRGDSPLVIGWVGTPSNVIYIHDILPALTRLREERPFILRIVTGNQSSVNSRNFGKLDVEWILWKPDTASREICNFDIGIMPLPDTEWTRYKCGFKLVQYMAAGIPAIASPIGVNQEMIRVGENGFLPVTQEDWYQALKKLLTDPALRKQMGLCGREIVEQKYSLQNNLPRMLAAFEQSSNRAANQKVQP